jgi:hypothetical protein
MPDYTVLLCGVVTKHGYTADFIGSSFLGVEQTSSFIMQVP